MKIPRVHLGKTALLLASSLPFSYQLRPLSTRADDPCSIAAAAFEGKPSGYQIPASIAYDCLKAIPFHEEDALHTIQQLRLFLQFYSAQAYFANPPTPELELTPVDLNKTLDDIETSIKSGLYKNNYAFDKAINRLFGYYRDGHVVYDSACYVPFVFEHPYPLLSVAETPTDMPVIRALSIMGSVYSVGDKVIKINDIESSEFLMAMANNHSELFWVDPDARYNQLLVGISDAKTVTGVFATRSTYDDEVLTLTWENGTKTKIEWTARLRDDLGNSWDSAETFYENICIRSQESIAEVYKDFDNPELSHNSEPTTSEGSKKRSVLPYIAPHVMQTVRRDESIATPVYGMPNQEISLYLLNEAVGVLVISAFAPLGDSPEDGFIPSFSANITGAIAYLREKGISKVIIDVSGNGGGFIRLGRDAVHQFFPGEPTFFASNMRWNPALHTMLTEGSNTDSTYWDLGQYKRASDGSDFKNYEELLGPIQRDGDSFTVTTVYDDVEVEKEDSEPLPASYSGPQPFADEDIILLSSGMCGSTCAVFAEAFENHGVHTIAVGGRPLAGPMQTIGGIKGSQVLTFDEIAGWAWKFLGNRVSDLEYIPEVLRANTFAAQINLRNSWRKDDQTLPIEFLYTPSEYRMIYTSEMIVNATASWEAAANIVWGGENDFLKAHGASGKMKWKSLGELIWSKMNGHEL